MRKIITITDPMLVKIGDTAYFKGYRYGFTVLETDEGDKRTPFMVVNPLSGCNFWALSRKFDHATREVEVGEPEWPDPHGAKLHVYLGSDGRRYIYYPINEIDMVPWSIDGTSLFRSRESMEADHRDALPLTELKLVPVKDDDGE